MNNGNDDDEDFPFSNLFSPIEKIFADFDRLFSDFPTIFTIPSQDSNNGHSQPSTNLRDEVLKRDFQNSPYSDEDLDSTIEKHGLVRALPRTYSNSSIMTTTSREITPSGKCVIERKIQHSFNHNENSNTETISKMCGDKYYTTVKQDGKIIREYGNSTTDELDRIDSISNDYNNDQEVIGGNKYSDFFKKLFS